MGLHIGTAVSKLIAGLGLSKKDKTQGTEKAGQVFANTISEPIGDTFNKSTENTVSVEDLMALVDDPDIDMGKLAEYSKQPVATLGEVSNVSDTNVTEDVKSMVAYTQNPGVGFYTNKAYSDGSANRIGAGTEATASLLDSGINPEAFYNALQG